MPLCSWPRSHPGDDEKAVALLDEALSAAHALEMHALAERLSARLEQRPCAAPTTLDNPADLSQRELEVLRHAAEMLDTTEIAAMLFISVNTVKSHLKSIYRKLAVTHRGEAVRRARQLRILGPGR